MYQNEYLKEISAGYQRSGHGLSPAQRGLLANMEEQVQPDGHLIIPGIVSQWPEFPAEEDLYHRLVVRYKYRPGDDSGMFGWYLYFAGGKQLRADRFAAIPTS